MPTGVYPRTPSPLADRFWPKVAVSGGGCWLWTGARNAQGYGRMAPSRRGGTMLRAHRVSWELHFGAIPRGMWVLHRCDNPSCVNPHHLFLGNRLDNMQDASRKGRIRTEAARAAKAAKRLLARGDSHTHVEPVHGCPECVQPADPYAVGLTR